MPLGRTYAVSLVGLNGYIVEVESDIGQTLPAFVLLGLPDGSPRYLGRDIVLLDSRTPPM